jgi:CBS domain containing-hemolysin-like protein
MMSDTAFPLGVWILALLLAALTVVLLVLSALLDRSGPIRVRHWVEEAGGRLRRLFDAEDRFEAYRYLLSLFARAAPVVLIAFLTVLLSRSQFELGDRAALFWSLGLVLFLVLVAESFTRQLSGHSEEALSRLTGLYRVLLFLFGPVVALAAPFFVVPPQDRGVGNNEAEEEASEDEIEAFLDVGAKEGILEPGEEDMILRVMDFGDAVVRKVMTPRIDMVCASIDTPLEELAGLFVESSHSRIPLFGDSVDDIRGVLHIRDLLGAIRSAQPVAAEKLAISPFFVPETKPLDALLRELQASHRHMALVVDEYGSTAGLVTIEDLLEEIVGEIVDEHDVEEPEVEKLADGSWRIDGMASLDALGDLFEIDLGEEPYDTVGGLVFGHVGDVPEPGTVIVAHGLQFTVESLDARRVGSLLVSRGLDQAKGRS